MKLYQKIMVYTFGILLVCGIICGWLMGRHFQNRQISRAAAIELSNYETAQNILQRLYMMEAPANDFKESLSLTVLEGLFEQDIFKGYILIDRNGTVCDSSEYMVSYDPSWPGKTFEETEYRMEKLDGEYLMVIGSREPWLSDTSYLFSVRDLTDIHMDVKEFLWQFTFIWFLMMVLVSVLMAAAAKIVLKPLEKLEAAARAVSEGNYSQVLDVKRKDEAGSLAEAFNSMSREVEAHVEELTRVGEMQKRLLGSLAHEIRTPMTSIIGYSDSLLHAKLGEKERERALKNIYEQAGYLQRLSAKMMELIGLHQNESIQKEPCDMRAVLEKALWMAEKKWPDRSFWLMGEENFTVRGDADLLVSLFGNILDNGAKASSANQEIQVQIMRKGEIQIRDFGKGIPKEEIEKIREPFYMSDKARGDKRGIGLGLAICEQIAKLHGAGMRIESEEGKGTTVHFLFTNCLRRDEDF